MKSDENKKQEPVFSIEEEVLEERKVINNGIKWVRYIFSVLAFFTFINILDTSEDRWRNIVFLMAWIGLYVLFTHARRLQYDSEHFYIIRGSKEKKIHFSNIKSIKRSRSKVNGSRFWILTYTNAKGKDRKCRFFLGWGQWSSKDFREGVRKVNPKVIIWEHPFFNH